MWGICPITGTEHFLESNFTREGTPEDLPELVVYEGTKTAGHPSAILEAFRRTPSYDGNHPVPANRGVGEEVSFLDKLMDQVLMAARMRSPLLPAGFPAASFPSTDKNGINSCQKAGERACRSRVRSSSSLGQARLLEQMPGGSACRCISFPCSSHITTDCVRPRSRRHESAPAPTWRNSQEIEQQLSRRPRRDWSCRPSVSG